MLITRLILKNWRNFRALDISLRETTYLLGPNAVGKSNLLDAFRFLRDLSKPKGGGLQAAVSDRDGLTSLRCLHARRDPRVQVEVYLGESADEEWTWHYLLEVESEGKGKHRCLISKEEIWKHGDDRAVVARPNSADKADPEQLTQTYLEQIQANARFRDLPDFFGRITYQHLVPQLLKFADKIGGQRIEDDPFGQGFMEQVARCSDKTRAARLKRIEAALRRAVPQFEELRFEKDSMGHPHLKARYKHHRPNAGWQSEEHFSDGTLRLLSLLWVLQVGDSMLLLEEPELSLNDAIVREIPLLFRAANKGRKTKRQVILSTHSEALLSNPGIDGRGVVLLEPGSDGSTARPPDSEEQIAMESGASPAEVLLPKTHPAAGRQLDLFG